MAADMAMVAPELVSGLEFFPDLDFSRGMEQFRQGFDARLAPPLPDALRAVS